MNEIEYFIFIPVKRFIATLACVCRYMLLMILITAILEILLLLSGLTAGLYFGLASDFLLSITIAILSLLTLWSHDVLLARRGNAISRFMCTFAIILSVILSVCSIYTICTHSLLLPKQDELNVIIPTILLVSALFNMPNMAAAPLKLRIMVPVFLLGVLLTAITTVVPIFCLLFKIVMACTGMPLLAKLQHVAPLIVSLPPRD
ncbi:MAG: hypothetical protein E7031_01475 [Akkermansiaceae bacterium]|nr:hypothetical protein [Akkermansiaceae bacterium]